MTEQDVAERLHKSRRWVRTWLSRHPVDRDGQPHVSYKAGRTLLFTALDIARILTSLALETPCPSSLSRPATKTRTTRSAAHTSTSKTTTELLTLLTSNSRKSHSEKNSGKSKTNSNVTTLRPRQNPH